MQPSLLPQDSICHHCAKRQAELTKEKGLSGASIDDDQLDSTIDVCMALQGDALIEENEREKYTFLEHHFLMIYRKRHIRMKLQSDNS